MAKAGSYLYSFGFSGLSEVIQVIQVIRVIRQSHASTPVPIQYSCQRPVSHKHRFDGKTFYRPNPGTFPKSTRTNLFHGQRTILQKIKGQNIPTGKTGNPNL